MATEVVEWAEAREAVKAEVVVARVEAAMVVVAAKKFRKCKLRRAKSHTTQLTSSPDCKSKCC